MKLYPALFLDKSERKLLTLSYRSHHHNHHLGHLRKKSTMSSLENNIIIRFIRNPMDTDCNYDSNQDSTKYIYNPTINHTPIESNGNHKYYRNIHGLNKLKGMGTF